MEKCCLKKFAHLNDDFLLSRKPKAIGFAKMNIILSQTLFLLIVLLPVLNIQAATRTSTAAGGNWNATGSWVNGGSLGIPAPGDDIVIAVGATMTVTTNTTCNSITWTGNPTSNGTYTLTVNAGVSLTVTGNMIIGAATNNNRNRQINVLGTLNCDGDFEMGASGGDSRDVYISIGTNGIVNIIGNLIMASSFARHHVDMTGNARINIGGNVASNAAGTGTGGGFTNPPAGSIINLNGTLPQNFWPQNAPTYSGTLKINNQAGVTFRKAMNLNASTLTIGDLVSNSLLKDSGFAITCTGTLNLENGSTYQLGRVGGAGGTSTQFPAFGAINIDLGTTVHYAHANTAQTISTVPSYANLLLSTTTSYNKTIAAGTLTVRGNLTIEANTTFNGANDPDVDIGGDFTNSGTFTSGTGLFTMNGTTNQSITGTALFSGGLTINNTGSGGSNTVTINNNITTAGNLTLTDGELDMGSFTANRTAAGGTLTIANGTRLIIGGTNGLPINYSTHSIGATSTVEYNGTTNTVTAPNSSQAYGNLVIAASGATTTGTFSIARTLTVTGSLIASSGIITMNNVASAISNSGTLTFNDLTISSTPTSQAQYNTSFTVAGTFATSGAITFAPTGGTITMTGATGAINNPSGTLTFQNLVINGTEISATGNFGVVGNMNVSTIFNPSATTIISGGGTLTGSGTVNVSRIASVPSFGAQYTIANKTLGSLTVDYIGAGNQTVDAHDYGNLVISTNGSRTVTFINGGTVGVSGVFTPTTVTTTYVVTGNIFDYNGSGAQTITAFTYNNLIVSNNGIKLIPASVIVNCQTIAIEDDAAIEINADGGGRLNVEN